MSSPALDPASGGAQWFATTHWSVVLAAKQGGPSEAAGALEKLCRTYWPPLYAYIRRDGCDKTEAQDLTQEFFARLLARDYLQQLRHQEGKFRSFLLAYLKNFLSEQRRKAGPQVLDRQQGPVEEDVEVMSLAAILPGEERPQEPEAPEDHERHDGEAETG